MKRYFYHYTTLHTLKQFVRDEFNRRDYPGIQMDHEYVPSFKPMTVFMRLDVAKESGCDVGAVNRPSAHGLLSPFPKEWCNHDPRYDMTSLEVILNNSNIGKGKIALLRIEVYPEDEAYVLESSMFEKLEMAESEEDWKTRLRGPYIEAQRMHWESRIPLFDYDESNGYERPEVVLFNSIPLEGRVKRIATCFQRDLVNQSRRIAGLQTLPRISRYNPNPARAALGKELLGLGRRPAVS